MTSQTGNARVDWRRAVVGGVLAVGLMSGFGVSDGVRPARFGIADSTLEHPRAGGELHGR